MARPELAITACFERILLNANVSLPAQFDLRKGTQAKLGRLEDSDFVLPMPTVSRNHADFQFRDESRQIRDLVNTKSVLWVTALCSVLWVMALCKHNKFFFFLGHECHYRDLADNLQRELDHVRSERDSLQHIVEAQLISNQGHFQEGLAEVLENELSCTICREVVIEPMVAQCGHVFCSHCITTWMRQSNRSCPCCRKRIVTSARVSTWNTFLCRAYYLLPEETRHSRERSLRQRREEHEAWEARQTASKDEVEVTRQRQDQAIGAYGLPIERIFPAYGAGPVGRLTFGHQRDTRPIMEEERRRARMALAARNQERVQEIFALVEAARIRLQRANEARIQQRGQGT